MPKQRNNLIRLPGASVSCSKEGLTVLCLLLMRTLLHAPSPGRRGEQPEPLETPESFEQTSKGLWGGMTSRNFQIRFANGTALHLSTFSQDDGRFAQYFDSVAETGTSGQPPPVLTSF
jgi:hypothetical protein